MTKRSEGEGVFICILTLQQQFANEVSAANVMHEVAEFGAAERVVAQILYDGASVGIRMSFGDLRFCQRRESAQQQRPDIIRPNQIDDLLVRQNGVCGRATPADQHKQEKCYHAERNTPWTHFFDHRIISVVLPLYHSKNLQGSCLSSFEQIDWKRIATAKLAVIPDSP
jgi:hypothetical protein